MKRHYSDYIAEELYQSINRIKIQKGYKETLSRHLKGYTFIFVEDDLSCITVDECDLMITETDEFDLEYIVVLLESESHYSGYWNHDYHYIGIFNINGDETDIEYSLIKLTSFSLVSDFIRGHYNKDIISHVNLLIQSNPFSQYLTKVLKPINKAMKKSLPKGFDIEKYDIARNEMPLTICPANINGRIYFIPDGFENFLKAIDKFDDYIASNLFSKNRSSKFNPEDYL